MADGAAGGTGTPKDVGEQAAASSTVAPLLCRVVDNRGHRRLHDLDLVGIEGGDELPADGGQVHGRSPPQLRPSLVGDDGVRRSSVLRIGLAADEIGGDELVDDAAHPRPAEDDRIAELQHPQPAARGGVELEEYVVPGQGQPRAADLGVDARHDGRVCSKEGRPGA